jgi:hypothetical protein
VQNCVNNISLSLVSRRLPIYIYFSDDGSKHLPAEMLSTKLYHWEIVVVMARTDRTNAILDY